MATKLPSIFQNMVLWFTGQHSAGIAGDYDEFLILPSGVTITNNGFFSKDDLGNNVKLLNFDGSTNYITLTDSSVWNIFGSDFTIAGWVNPSIVDDTSRQILGQWVDGNNIWELQRTGTSINTLRLYARVSSSYTFDYSCPWTPNAGTWYHLVVQRSGSSCLMYVNGVAQTVTVSTAFTGTTDIASPLYIGKGVSVYYGGKHKDLMIANRVMSAAEIKMLYIKTHPVNGTGIIQGPYDYWRLS